MKHTNFYLTKVTGEVRQALITSKENPTGAQRPARAGSSLRQAGAELCRCEEYSSCTGLRGGLYIFQVFTEYYPYIHIYIKVGTERRSPAALHFC